MRSIRTSRAATVVLLSGALLLGCGTELQPSASVGDGEEQVVSAPPAPAASPRMASATSTQPADHEVVALRVDRGSDAVLPVGTGQMIVLADGRVVRPSGDHWSQVILTQPGIDDLVERATATGLFEADAEYGPEPANMFAGITSVTVDDGPDARTVRVIHPADEESARTLVDLADELLAFETWLPDSAWSDREPRRYRPQSYFLYISFSPNLDVRDAVSRPEVDIAAVRLPFDAPLHQIGQATGPDNRCAVIDGDMAAAIRRALREAGVELGPSESEFTSADLLWEARRGTLDIAIFAVPPGDEPACRG